MPTITLSYSSSSSCSYPSFQELKIVENLMVYAKPRKMSHYWGELAKTYSWLEKINVDGASIGNHCQAAVGVIFKDWSNFCHLFFNEHWKSKALYAEFSSIINALKKAKMNVL